MSAIGRSAIFTIISNNYVAYASALMESVARAHPEWAREVLIVDMPSAEVRLPSGLFNCTYVQDLSLPNPKHFLFRYGIMELNTAVKPWMFELLLDRGYSEVIYLDPDILVTDRMDALAPAWRAGSSIVLTPHLTAPTEDERHPGELEILRSGSFNLGFMAVRDTATTRAMLKWWQRKLEFQAASDVSKGIFTDQKWVDLVPGMFEGVSILRDPGYNVAYWNLAQRPLSRRGGNWWVADRPLRFFHFSGIDPENPEALSKHQDRFTLSTVGAAKEFFLDYCKAVLRWNFAKTRKVPYAFGRFSDGVAIPDVLRSYFRDSTHLQSLAGKDPFSAREKFGAIDRTGLSAVAIAVWRKRHDLQLAFPKPYTNDRRGYISWFTSTAGTEMGIAEEFIAPFRKVQLEGADGDRRAQPELFDVPHLPFWGQLICQLHLWLAPEPSRDERRLYSGVNSLGDFIRVGVRQFGELLKYRLGQLNGLWHAKGNRLAYAIEPEIGASLLPMSARKLGLPTPLIVGGLYPVESTAPPWVGQGFHVRISGAPSHLRVKGVHQAANFERAFGSPDLEVQVTINGSGVGSFTVRKEGEFSVGIPLDSVATEDVCVLGLRPIRTFVPRELGINDDRRELSFQLETLVLDEQISLFGYEMASVPTAQPQAHEPALIAPTLEYKLGVNLVGYLRSEHGVGESARLFANALACEGIDHCLIDFNVGNASRTNDHSLAYRLVEQPEYTVNVFHINADQMQVAKQSLAEPFFRERVNVGYWAWELPEFPTEWTRAFQLVDEVWVPSLFVQEAIAKKSPVPVVRIPHSIRFDVSKTVARADFKIPEDKFVFLVMYDFSSYQERKNPKAALAAFAMAFPNVKDTTLVIKTQNSHLYPEQRKELEEWIDARSDVVWIDKTLDRQVSYELISVCDAYVSLHRSEGFGIVIAEAMYLGKPVIATNWSGNRDFMDAACAMPVDYEIVRLERDIGVYKAGQSWAEPDVEHAARLMRQVVEDQTLRRRISTAAARRIRDTLAPELVGKIIRQRMLVIEKCIGR